MITDTDIKKLATVFATKQDILNLKLEFISEISNTRVDLLNNIEILKEDLTKNTDYIVKELIGELSSYVSKDEFNNLRIP